MPLWPYSPIGGVTGGGSAEELPALALTAFAMVADRQEGLAAGFQGYVAKPIELGALTRTIQEVLGRRAGAD
jgi:CheY-like chemotaxis protein